MTEQELRQRVVAIAAKYIGCKESDGSHRRIIDIYNSHRPLARGYAVKYTDPWCSAFASAVAIEAGLTDIIPTECGCEKHVRLFQGLGSWQENDAYVPAPGDYIFYDWEDTGIGDNTGSSDHVGIVEKVAGGVMTVIEGNISHQVGRRTLTVNGRYIRGFGVPKYGSKAAGTAQEAAQTDTAPEAGQEQVYTVVKGDSLWAIAARYGTTYQQLAAYNGIADPSRISVGQRIRIPGKAAASQQQDTASQKQDTASQQPASQQSASQQSAAGAAKVHRVVKGDTLWALSRQYGTTVAKIVAANKAQYPSITASYIVTGWVLTIP